MDFGVREAGGDVVFANDVLKAAAETHKRYFPETDFNLGDIREIDAFPEADLVVGGYPCQSFSMGGNRRPENDPRTYLFREFARTVASCNAKFFVAENVSGLKSVESGRWLQQQVDAYASLGEHGYRIRYQVLDAQDYGVPQRRKRLFIVGVRKDLGLEYEFPEPTHGSTKDVRRRGLLPYTSHGDAIRGLPLWPTGEFYERPHDPEGHFSWYYMSRNRKAAWAEPSFTVVANFRHTTLHPASSTMKLLWSNLADGWKQGWGFSGEYEHLAHDPLLPVLEQPRRLSWREAAAIQTFPQGFEPDGDLMRKFEQIGNAVPPLLAAKIIRPLISGEGLHEINALRSDVHSGAISHQLAFL
jgi:DNA (cytosine-5)-methyltransferase 1